MHSHPKMRMKLKRNVQSLLEHSISLRTSEQKGLPLILNALMRTCAAVLGLNASPF